MPKNNAERVRACIARKRDQARKNGLCGRCCKERPDPGRSMCLGCNLSATERVRRKRKRDREGARLLHIIEAHERAGDLAREHHLYKDAAQRYQRVLDMPMITSADRLRISGKLSYALFSGSNSGTAKSRFQFVVPEHLEGQDEGGEAVKLLLRRCRQLWADSKADEVLMLIAQAIGIAKILDNPYFHKIANLTMASYLHVLGRFNEVEDSLRAVGAVEEQDDVSVRDLYYELKAVVAASFGRAQEAHEGFELAVRIAEDDPDPQRVATIWNNYGSWAADLGNTEVAKVCEERALLIARQNQIIWRIPGLCLSYADLLVKMGQYDAARSYLLDALSYDAQAPLLDAYFAQTGIPLALYLKDEETLTKCIRPSAIDSAFRSKQPANIGSVAAAFARLYATQGKSRKAQKLLHRALEMVHRVESSWDLPLEVARCGASADTPRARGLLEARTAFPSCDVARACLSLFDAFVAQRRKQPEQMLIHVNEAIQRFDALRWHGYADVARALLPAASGVRLAIRRHDKPFTSIQPALTLREQQVAECILKGLTNRAIAAELSISKYTVDSHVASIMNRVGIRSRYQLAEALKES